MSKRLRILLTNDDGYFSAGINALFRELKKEHSVFMIAPDREQSASSHSLTLNHPLRMHKVGDHRWITDGTPTDCVLLGIHSHFKKRPPDMIISGINHGPNMGEDVTYSGTVAAAIEGAIIGIPSMALSLASDYPGSTTSVAKFTTKIIRAYKAFELTSGTFLNVNFPSANGRGYRQYAFTSQGARKYKDIVHTKIDPRGVPYYWIGGRPKWKLNKGSDFAAVSNGLVSITPMKMEFTDIEAHNRLGQSSLRL